MFSLNKSSVVHEKPNTPKSCLRWIPTGRIFKLAGLRWIPTRKMFIDSTTKVDSEPPNGSNEDITNPYECDQTLNVSAGTLNLSAVQASLFSDQMASADNSSGPRYALFCPERNKNLFDEYFNPSPSVAQPVLEAAVQDTPSTSISQTIKEAQSHVIPTSVEEDDHGTVLDTWIMICNLVFQLQNLVLKNPLPELLSQPTPVSTRLLLQTKALFCYYDALLSSSEYKSYKDALTKSCWIDAMKSSMSLNIWRFGS
ncbi:hypothetical protein Tco_0252542 [Tanacetum coccineum]